MKVERKEIEYKELFNVKIIGFIEEKEKEREKLKSSQFDLEYFL